MSRTPFGRALEELVETVRSVVPAGTEVGLGRPGEEGPDREAGEGACRVDITVLSADGGAPTLEIGSRHLPVTLTTLVSVSGDPVVELDLLHDLWLALDQSAVELGSSSTATPWWAIWEVAPRPALVVELAAVAQRRLDVAPLVVDDLDLHHLDDRCRTVRGTVVGPSERPLSGARVSVVGVARAATRTGPAGEFAISGVFDGDQITLLVERGAVSAEQVVDLDNGRPVQMELRPPT